MATKEELIRACATLKEYLDQYVCECDECDDCFFCAGDILYDLEQLEKIIRNNKE